MKAVFVVGFFPDKSSAFLDQLCRHFRVIMFRQQHFATPNSGSVEFAEDLVGNNEVEFPWSEFCWELHLCIQTAEQEIAKHFPQPEYSSLRPDEYKKLYNLAFQVFYIGRYLPKLHEKAHIDMVIANADCSATRRVIVMEAKKLGIPTLDVEHGYNHVVMPTVKALVSDYTPTPMRVADFVNSDNALEQRTWEEYLDFAGLGDRTKSVVNGTPNDVTTNRDMTKHRARELLRLDQNAFTVTIIGTWHEARDSSVVLKGLLQEVQFYKSTLAVLGDIARQDFVQILVKLHPAYARKTIFADTSRCLKKLSEKSAVEIQLVTTEYLSEVIAASDLVISPTDSSVVWESFLASTPGIIYPATEFLTTFYEAEKLNEGNELARRGCLKYVFEEAQLRSVILHFRKSENRVTFEEAARDIRARYQLTDPSPEVKSLRICRWIEETLNDRQNGSPPSDTREVSSADQRNQVEWLYATGCSFIDEGRLKEGLTMLTKVLDITPQHYGTLHQLGSLFDKLGDTAKADEMRRLASQSHAAERDVACTHGVESPDKTAAPARVRIREIRPDMTGVNIRLCCGHCEHSFDKFQPTVLGLAFGMHKCPNCETITKVGPEDFEASRKQLLPTRGIDEILKVNREATRIAETWYRTAPMKKLLDYHSVNLGEPTERGLVGCISLGLYLSPPSKHSDDAAENPPL